MKTTFVLVLTFLSVLIFAQDNSDKSFFPAKYVLKSSNDTIRAKVRNVGKFTNRKYSSATILYKMKMRDATGKEIWVQPKDVEYISISDENNIRHEFFASDDRLPVDVGLVEILYEGENVSWYKGGSSEVADRPEDYSFIVDIRKNKFYHPYSYLNQSVFKKIFEGDPELVDGLKKAKTTDDYLQLLKIYDTKD